MRAALDPAASRSAGLQPALLLFAAWLCLVIDAVIPTAQLLAVGSIVLPPILPKLALIAIGAAATLLTLRWRTPRSLALWLVAFTIYLLICSARLWNLAATDPDADSNLLYYYTGFFILALCHSCRGTLPERTVWQTIVALSAPLAVLGICQNLSGDPILPLLPNSDDAADPFSDGNISLVATDFHGELRGYSLFTSGLAFGHFLNLAVGILIPMLCHKRGYSRLITLGLLMLSAVAVYSTLTRAVYIQLGIVAVSALLFTLTPRARGRIGLLNISFGLCAAVVVTVIQPLTALNTSGILVGDTYRLRLAEWALCWNDLTRSATTVLFGTGATEGQSNYVVIDNGPLAVTYQAGIIGLLFWVAGIYIILRYVKQRLAASPSYLTIGVAAYMTSWLCASMFNLATDEGARITVLLVLCHSAASPRRDLSSGGPQCSTALMGQDGPGPLAQSAAAVAALPSMPAPLLASGKGSADSALSPIPDPAGDCGSAGPVSLPPTASPALPG